MCLAGCLYDPSGNPMSEPGTAGGASTTSGSTVGETTAAWPTTGLDGSTGLMSTSGTDATTEPMPTSGTDTTGTSTTGGGVCGDGVPDPGEGCDDGNQVDGDACTNACALPICGDGIVSPAELCDDGNQIDNDDCTNLCATKDCGDGIVQAPESCDDMGESADCNDNCTTVACGDGNHNQSAGEDCDDMGESAKCNDDCTLASCGDGKLNQSAGETCEAAYVVDDTCAPGCVRVRLVEVGYQHACAVYPDDTLHCWGGGIHGQLGHGATTDLGDSFGEVPTAPVPFGPGKIVRLALSTVHTCILLAGGAVRCWGLGNGGQLGNGMTVNIGTSPGELPTDDLVFDQPVIDLDVGALHTCVLLANGKVRCWGEGSEGRLGYGNSDDLLVPPAVDVPLAEDAVQIACGGSFTCSLHANHAVRCWGNNTYGQLANGGTLNKGDMQNDIPPPEVPVTDPEDPVERLAAGYNHTCALLQSGKVRCWGWGGYGKLGTGSTASVGSSPGFMITDVNLDTPAVQVIAAYDHTCARTAAGAVQCWGRRTVHGVPNEQDFDMPGEFPPPALKLGGPARDISSHFGDFTCASLDDGKVRCWGSNNVGQLGYGYTAEIGDNEHPDAAGPVPF